MHHNTTNNTGRSSFCRRRYQQWKMQLLFPGGSSIVDGLCDSQVFLVILRDLGNLQ
ncbi:hypothetical protein [Pseudoflavitalea rhizosphaerae]|uniref:hypothetical protein n=1 Tax=Pseudoflavitalea rhizosphaerae TaxID=1884793 RepID=UPI0013DFD9E8|nr:hypothetical protein [Pseudoflavitalea rhizosphaerae]